MILTYKVQTIGMTKDDKTATYVGIFFSTSIAVSFASSENSSERLTSTEQHTMKSMPAY